MIRYKSRLNRFYRELIRKEKLTHKEALSLYEALHREAVSFGVINSKNALEGLETDLKIARMIQSMKSD